MAPSYSMSELSKRTGSLLAYPHSQSSDTIKILVARILHARARDLYVQACAEFCIIQLFAFIKGNFRKITRALYSDLRCKCE